MSKFQTVFKKIWSTNRTLITGLTLPLLLATAFALWLSRPITIKDVFLNLATDFITIVITVWYVDWILRRQEQFRWHNTEKYISGDGGRLGHALIVNIVEGLMIGDQIYPSKEQPWHTRKVEDFQEELLTNVKKINRDYIISKLKLLDPSQWAILMKDIKSRTNEITLMLSQFGSKLDPEKLEVLLSLKQAIDTAYSTYSLFYGFLGVPLENLPKVKDGGAFEYSILATIRIGIDLEILLKLCLTVIENFQYIVHPPEIDYDEEVRKSWDRYFDLDLYVQN
ncbi:MAG: hypothetical protein HN921_11300 [Bacteroidetes bacterium]|jgi:hypothetical protein|nr:hypothetical protein [Bacteroidota bacterium]